MRAVLPFRLGGPHSVLKLHIQEMERRVDCCLLEIVVEDTFVEAGKDVALTRHEDHL